MSATILSRPTKSGSNWNALGNPVIFKLRRDDHTISFINDNVGFAQIQINGINLTSYYQAGDTIILNDTVTAQTVTTTVAGSSFSGGNTLVDVNSAFTSSTFADVITNLSKRTDYRIEYNFKSIAGIKLLGSDLTVAPGSDAIMLLNASLLKNLLTASWSLPGSINVADSDGSIEFYISYQEYYDGALQGSVTNDSSNPINGLLGANQIGYAHGSNMLSYFLADNTKKFLTRFQLSSALKGLKMWRDWPFTLSFIYPDGLTDLALSYIQYDQAGTEISTNRSTINTASDNAINRLLVPEPTDERVTRMTMYLLKITAGSYSSIPITNGTFTGSLAPWDDNVPSPAGTAWTYSSNAVQVSLASVSAASKALLQTLATPISNARDGFIRMSIDILIPNTKQVDIFLMYNAGSLPGSLGSSLNVIGDGSSHVVVVTSSIIGVTDSITQLGFRVISDDTVAGNIIVTSVSFELSPPNAQSETLDIQVEDACDYDENNIPIPWKNPILLQWKNSNGGDAWWMFPLYHEVSENIRDKKAKRIILFADDLDPVQWEAINELNSVNEVYSPAIIDLENTNTINSTSKQIGKQVYMVDIEGATTGVIVIPSSDRINARDVGHRISIEIELPEFIEA